jgi:xylulokinase
MHAPIVKTSVDQNAASLGAAALAFVGAGLWKDYSRIDQVHRVESALTPDVARSALYDPMYEAFRKVAHHMSEIGLMLDSL